MNKNREALSRLVDFAKEQLTDYEKTLQELIEKREKYCWHRLTENVFDLPRDFETVLCCTKDGYLTMYRQGVCWITTEDDIIYSTTKNTTYVKGWKYIEEFE